MVANTIMFKIVEPSIIEALDDELSLEVNPFTNLEIIKKRVFKFCSLHAARKRYITMRSAKGESFRAWTQRVQLAGKEAQAQTMSPEHLQALIVYTGTQDEKLIEKVI